jgi:hypothetical protein
MDKQRMTDAEMARANRHEEARRIIIEREEAAMQLKIERELERMDRPVRVAAPKSPMSRNKAKAARKARRKNRT